MGGPIDRCQWRDPMRLGLRYRTSRGPRFCTSSRARVSEPRPRQAQTGSGKREEARASDLRYVDEVQAVWMGGQQGPCRSERLGPALNTMGA